MMPSRSPEDFVYTSNDCRPRHGHVPHLITTHHPFAAHGIRTVPPGRGYSRHVSESLALCLETAGPEAQAVTRKKSESGGRLGLGLEWGAREAASEAKPLPSLRLRSWDRRRRTDTLLRHGRARTVWLSVRTLQGGALVVWPETLSRTPWLINKSAGGPPFSARERMHSTPLARVRACAVEVCDLSLSICLFNTHTLPGPLARSLSLGRRF